VCLSVAACLGLGLMAGGCRPAKPAGAQPVVVRYQLTQPAAQVQTRALYVGILRGDPETELSFRVGGILDLIGPATSAGDWHEGVAVTNRQLLAQLKQEDFDIAVDEAEAKLTLAEAVFQRTERLHRDQTVSPQELDVARANRDSARAALRKAKEALADSRIYAPYDGFILARLANAGETIPSGRPVLRVADMRTNALEVGVPDTLVNQVRTNRPCMVTVSAFEGLRFVGWVSEVGRAAKEGTRLFRVVVKIPNHDRDQVLRAGMSATVDLAGTEPPDGQAVVVPLSALISRADGSNGRQLAVYVVGDDGRTRERPVRTGNIVRSSILVTGGLRPGEKVVTFGLAQVHDGALVRAIPENGLGKE